MDLEDRIAKLKAEQNAILLAHYYQTGDIQDVADFVGDSLELAKYARSAKADIIVFAGVYFMAETAKILNPGKTVLIPDLEASCSLSIGCPPNEFRKFISKYPDHVVVSYINCSAKIKALSDIICTSSNALDIINSFPPEQGIIFAPDRNFGAYIKRVTGRDLVLWDATCVVHESFSVDKLLSLTVKHPNAELIAHPESDSKVLSLARHIGSTSSMLDYVQKSDCREFLVATEAGILHQMQQLADDKELIPVPIEEDNTCACSECAYMKLNTLEKIVHCLETDSNEVIVDPEIAEKALKPLNRMLNFKNA